MTASDVAALLPDHKNIVNSADAPVRFVGRVISRPCQSYCFISSSQLARNIFLHCHAFGGPVPAIGSSLEFGLAPAGPDGSRVQAVDVRVIATPPDRGDRGVATDLGGRSTGQSAAALSHARPKYAEKNMKSPVAEAALGR